MSATKIPFFVVDSFTRTAFEGNPAGVFFDDTGALSPEEMRLYASELHLESAFVSPSIDSEADFSLRFFTGVTEVPLCGHATVAAITALRSAGRIASNVVLRLATASGLISASIADDGNVTLYQGLKSVGPAIGTDLVVDITSALGMPVAATSDTALPVHLVSTGTPWLFVPVRRHSDVDDVRPNFGEIARISRKTDTFGVYIFCRDAKKELHGLDHPQLAVWSRCFAPAAGLNEDPVTGSASGALGVYFVHNGMATVGPGESVQIEASQGFAGGRGGHVQIVSGKNTAGAIYGASIKGAAIMIADGRITVR